jgi:hypothetical protein
LFAVEHHGLIKSSTYDSRKQLENRLKKTWRSEVESSTVNSDLDIHWAAPSVPGTQAHIGKRKASRSPSADYDGSVSKKKKGFDNAIERPPEDHESPSLPLQGVIDSHSALAKSISTTSGKSSTQSELCTEISTSPVPPDDKSLESAPTASNNSPGSSVDQSVTPLSEKSLRPLELEPPDGVMITDYILPMDRYWVSPLPFQINLTQPTYQYSDEKLAIVQEAAEFLFSCSLFEDAFPLYHLIWKQYRLNQNEFTKPNLAALVGCVRCAVIEADLDLIAMEIESTVIRRPSHCKDIESLILPVLSLIVTGRQGGRFTFGDLSTISSHFSGAEVGAFLPNDDNPLTLNLLTYWLMTLGFSFRLSQFTGSWDMRDLQGLHSLDRLVPHKNISREHILKQCPGPFELQSPGGAANKRIRDCLDWCLRKIRLVSTLEQRWGRFRNYPLALDWKEAKSTALFLYLWDHWNEHRKDSFMPSWTKVKGAFDISATELLKATSFLIMKEFFRDSKSGSSRLTPNLRLSRYLYTFLEQAETGAIALASLPDSDLAEKFLDNYMEINFDNTYPSRPPRTHLQRKEVMDYVQEAMEIKILERRTTSIRPVQARSRNRESNTTASSRVSAIAPSLSSSSMSSMRRLALGIMRGSRISRSSRGSTWTVDADIMEEMEVTSMIDGVSSWDRTLSRTDDGRSATNVTLEIDSISDRLSWMSLPTERLSTPVLGPPEENSKVRVWPLLADPLRNKQ